MRDVREIDVQIRRITLNKTNKGRYLLQIAFFNNSDILITLENSAIERLKELINYHNRKEEVES